MVIKLDTDWTLGFHVEVVPFQTSAYKVCTQVARSLNRSSSAFDFDVTFTASGRCSDIRFHQQSGVSFSNSAPIERPYFHQSIDRYNGALNSGSDLLDVLSDDHPERCWGHTKVYDVHTLAAAPREALSDAAYF